MSDAKNPPAPKFTSFRPKPAPTAPKSFQQDTNEQSEKHDKPRHRDGDSKGREGRRRRASHSEEKKPKPDDRQHQDLSRRKHKHITTRDKPSPLAAVQPQEDEQAFYIIDRKGDPANVTYGRVHRYSIPPFRRYGYGRVLGMPKNKRIDFGATTDQEIHIRNDDNRARPARTWAAKYKPSNEPRILRLIRPDAEDAFLDEHLDYIPLPSNRKRKRGSESPGSPSKDHVDYRSIEGQAKANSHPADSDLEYESDRLGQDNEMGVANAEYEIRLKNAALSNRTKETPRDLQAWLELVDHQQDMVLLGRTYPSQDPNTSERRSIADIRISILTQALREIRVKQDRVLLVNRLMNEGKHYWESKQLAKKWEETLNEYPDSVELWTNYLDFAQTNFVDFKYENCRGIFRTCLEMLAKVQTTAPADQSRSTIIDIQAYILLRLASLIKEAGYHEHAVSLWQALLEYHMFRPSTNQESLDENSLLIKFEEFWESEVSRIGEVDAKGWDKFDQFQTPVPSPISLNLRKSIKSGGVFDDFSALEEENSNALKLPGRSADDAGDDDPFHLVLFSDIQEFLSLLPQTFPHDILIEAFLCFWHMPPLSFQNKSNTQHWWQDSFFRDEAIGLSTRESLSILLRDDSPSSNGFSEYLKAFSSFPMNRFQMTPDSLFNDAFKRQHHSIDREFIRRVLKQIALISTDDRIAEYYLAFELQNFPDTARKSAKQLLKKRPTSLRLYNAYALIEARMGETETSDYVFCTALGMAKGLSEGPQCDRILLWHTWIWEALDYGGVAMAIHRAMSIGDAKPKSRPNADFNVSEYSAAAILRVKNILRDGRDLSLSTAQYVTMILYISCHAILSYLLSDFDIGAALAIHHDASDAFDKRNLSTSPAAELNHQAQARLLALHASRSHSFKPSLIRDELAQSVALFPNNTMLLAVYAANEARFRIDDRVRTIMRDVVLKDAGSRGQAPSIVGWAFSIYSEMSRGETLGSTAHSVRATFEKAVESDCGRNSQALWTSYVLFEVAQHKPNQALQVKGKKAKVQSSGLDDRAKRVFFRGLTRLPWCKPYMMLAFSRMRSILTFGDLKRIYNVLGEKELRVHVDLEEAFEAVEEARAEGRGHASGLILPEDAESIED